MQGKEKNGTGFKSTADLMAKQKKDKLEAFKDAVWSMPIWLIVVISVAAVVLITLLVCAIRFVKNNSSQTSEAEKALQKEI